VAISVITIGELAYGAAKSADRVRAAKGFEWVMRTMPILPLPPKAGDRYGDLLAELERSGSIIGGNDLWIAAHALAEGLILVTNNGREFRRIRGLKIENWVR
jgi:tRNA(fMet)-specific endonuclease VapC